MSQWCGECLGTGGHSTWEEVNGEELVLVEYKCEVCNGTGKNPNYSVEV